MARHRRHAVDGAAAGQGIEDADLDRRLLGNRRSGAKDADGSEHHAVFHVVFPPDLTGTVNRATPISIRGVCAGNARNSKPTLTRVVTIGGGLGNWEATHRQY